MLFIDDDVIHESVSPYTFLRTSTSKLAFDSFIPTIIDQVKRTMRNIRRTILFVALAALISIEERRHMGGLFTSVEAFVVQPFRGRHQRPVFAETSTDLPDIVDMKAGQMRKELESYGISTKSFLEKSELMEAVKKARAEGKTPVNGSGTSSSPSTSTTTPKKEPVNGETQDSSQSRTEKIEKEMEKARGMSVADLRKELTSRGVSTKSFFEKSEFVKAYAEAVVDGTKTQQSSPPKEEEVFDPAYLDVTVQKMGRQDQQRLLQGGRVIDIKLKK